MRSEGCTIFITDLLLKALAVCFCTLFATSAILIASSKQVSAEPITSRIINGTSKQAGDAPWMASLHVVGAEPLDPFGGGHFCGAFLIHQQYLLSAAHCVYGYRSIPTQVAATLGRTLLSDTNSGVTVGIDSIAIHPNYNDATLDFDIAVLKLHTPVQIAPVSIIFPGADGISSGTLGSIFGWGVSDAGLAIAAPTDNLQEATVPVPSQSTCVASMGSAFHPANMLCAGQLASFPLATDGIDGCYGDSGGPLMTTLSLGGNRMVGISSWGYDDCASYKYYGVYSRIDAASAWIYGIVPISPQVLQAPSLAGLSQVGQNLTCNKGMWDGSSLSYQYRFESSTGDTLQNGTSTVYIPSAPDIGKSIRCSVIATGSGGTATSNSAFSVPVASVATPSPNDDKTPPTILTLKRSCRGTSCKLLTTTKDRGNPPSGVVRLGIKGTWRGRVCSKVVPQRCQLVTRSLKFSTQTKNSTQFLSTFNAPKLGTFKLLVRAYDRAGNRSALKRLSFER